MSATGKERLDFTPTKRDLARIRRDLERGIAEGRVVLPDGLSLDELAFWTAVRRPSVRARLEQLDVDRALTDRGGFDA